jgi:DNA ligase-1
MKTILVLLLFLQSVFAQKPDLFLLKTYDKNIDVVGWVMSEKLDGVRGFWDGQKLISRGGKVFNPPKWFIKNFPTFAIDGELWTKQNDFENIVSIVRSKKDKGWKTIKLMVFEVPNQESGLLDRLNILEKYLAKKPHSYIEIIKQTVIKTKSQVSDFLEEVTNKKGEGVVLRNPNISYKTGRLSSALKVKKHFDDECIVQEILAGKGKYQNKMGAIKCKIKNGKIFKIGSGFKDSERENPPKIGTTITFKYYGLTKKGNFKYPVFLRIRPQ